MENIQFAQYIQLGAEPSEFWDTASSIVSIISVVAIATASMYRYYTIKPMEKLYLKGMERAWMNLTEAMTQVFGGVVALLLSNFGLLFLVKNVLTNMEGCKEILTRILADNYILLLLAIMMFLSSVIIYGAIRLICKFFGISKWENYLNRSHSLIDKIVGIAYFLCMFVAFPFLSYFLIKVTDGSIDAITRFFIEKWTYILILFLFEWFILISLGIKGFIPNVKRQRESVYMKLLNSKNGEELKVFFMENEMLICASEDEKEDNKYQFIPMKDVYDGNYVLTSNKGNIYVKKN